MNGRPKTPASSRFWSKVDKSGECWLWTAATAGRGYGVIGETRTHMVYAHRLSYEMAFGAIPDGQWVLHRCDTPRCVRPDHLFLGDVRDNVADMVEKGRSTKGRQRPELRGSSNHQSKLTDDDVRRIRSSELSASALAVHYGVSDTLIYQIRRRVAWRHVA